MSNDLNRRNDGQELDTYEVILITRVDNKSIT